MGQGYVGLPLAMRAVEVGHTVVGHDTDEIRVKRLASADSYVADVSSEVLAAALASGRYHPTTEPRDCAGFDVALVSVPTPMKDGNPDLSFVEAAASTLARYVRPGSTVVLESTTYPGTTEERFAPILEEGSGLTAGVDFHVGFSPERIDPGNGTWNLANTPKLVSGVNAPSLRVVREFYSGLVERTVPVSGTREAELAKLIENTFRHVNIALVNELSMFAAELGIDVMEAIDAASTKPFGYLRFTPGPGVGGQCLPIGPAYLSWRVKRALGYTFRFAELALDVNEHMPAYVARRVTLGLNRRGLAVRGSRVLLLGLAYKRNVGDARESPSLRVAELLLGLGAHVRAADPHVLEPVADPAVALVELTPEELSRADAVVLMTDHDAFDLAAIVQHARYLLDTRHRLQGDAVERL